MQSKLNMVIILYNVKYNYWRKAVFVDFMDYLKEMLIHVLGGCLWNGTLGLNKR